jgi:hypothetical protein
VRVLYRCLFLCLRLTLKHQAAEKPIKPAKGALASPFSGLPGFALSRMALACGGGNSDNLYAHNGL